MHALPSNRLAWVGRALLTALALALAARASAFPVMFSGIPRSCRQAQLIAGQLVCDEEQVSDLRELCANATGPLEPGDAVELDTVCASGLPGRMTPEDLAALEQVVDLNRASAAELASLPGIGPKLAERIIAARLFASVDEAIEVRGIGAKRLAAIRPRARVTPTR